MRCLKIVAFFIIGIALARNYVHAEVYGCIKGYVKDKDTGKGIGKAKVILCKMRTDVVELGYVLTDERGFFTIKKVPAGNPYFLSCEKKGYIEHKSKHLGLLGFESLKDDEFAKIFGTFVLKDGDTKNSEIVLEKGGTLKGKIFPKVDEAILMRKACVSIRKEYEEGDFFKPHPIYKDYYYVNYSIVDKNVNYAFHGLKPSKRYEIKIEKRGFPTHYIHNVEIKKNRTTTIDYSFDIKNGTGIKGIITQKNQPLKDTYIELILVSNGASIAEFMTSDDGRYIIRAVEPGFYHVRIHYIKVGTEGYQWFLPLKLKPGQMEILNIDFPPSRLSKKITYRSSTQ